MRQGERRGEMKGAAVRKVQQGERLGSAKGAAVRKMRQCERCGNAKSSGKMKGAAVLRHGSTRRTVLPGEPAYEGSGERNVAET